MYSISNYGGMIADHIRSDAYALALRRAVRDGAVVLDLGCGTGIFSLLACQFGARRVFALEPDSAIQVARETARANGCQDRIVFIQDVSTRIDLPERVDVMISDIRGMLPTFRHHIPVIVDARKRHLKLGGTLIPMRDVLHAAVVEATEIYSALMKPWQEAHFNLDLTAARRYVLNSLLRARLSPDSLLTVSQPWFALDYATVDCPTVSGGISQVIRRQGTAHGVLVWFDTLLSDGIGFSNSPAEPELIYGSVFFPWLQPVPVDAGDQVSIDFQANLVGDDYVWRWNSRVLAGERASVVKAEFEQSSFYGIPLVPEELHKRALNYTPTLGDDGEVDQFALSLMGSGLNVGEIAARVRERFPDRFPRMQDAVTRVGELSQKYSR